MSLLGALPRPPLSFRIREMSLRSFAVIGVLIGSFALFGVERYAFAQTTDKDAAARIEAADAASKAAAEAAAKAEDEAQAQIDATNAQIQKLKDEIAQLQSQLNSTTAQKSTLQNAIKQLDLQIQKLQKSLSLTTTQISQKDTEIKKLSTNIQTTAEQIASTEAGVADSLRELQQLDMQSPVTSFLSGGTLSDFFDQAVTLGALRDELQNKIYELSGLKSSLQSSKTSAETKKQELAALKKDLTVQQQGASVARASQNTLLAETKNKESEYQKLIAQKEAEQDKFEADLIRLAAGLGTADTSSAPSAARGILSWPLDSVKITQYFGNTSFAQSGAYSGKGHNGMDFRAAIGTPVRAALDGTVQEVNQGAVKNCQYGKWVLVRHDNGLTTLYAHLSSISVGRGSRVSTGDVVGLAGDTGYATGPHLHFTVYVSSAISFKQYTCNSGSSAFIPAAPLNAYLNPLSYLPSL